MTSQRRPAPIAKFDVPSVERARRKFWRGLAYVAVAVLLLLSTNVVVDPRNEFPFQTVDAIVPDAAYDKLTRFDALAETPEVLVVGTSRGMALGAVDPARPNGTFNFAFAGGEVPAVDLVLTYARAQGKAPTRVVYVLDQFAMRDDRQERIKSSKAYPEMGGTDAGRIDIAKALGTLDLEYLQDTLTALRHAAAGTHPDFGARFDQHGMFYQSAIEAGLRNGTHDRTAAVQDIEQRVLGPTFADSVPVDEGAVARLQDLVQREAAAGVQVHVVLPPFLPETLEKQERRPGFQRLYGATLGVALGLCPLGIEVYDYTKIASFGGNPTYFSDAYHMTATNGRLLLDAVADKRGELCSKA